MTPLKWQSFPQTRHGPLWRTKAWKTTSTNFSKLDTPLNRRFTTIADTDTTSSMKTRKTRKFLKRTSYQGAGAPKREGNSTVPDDESVIIQIKESHEEVKMLKNKRIKKWNRTSQIIFFVKNSKKMVQADWAYYLTSAESQQWTRGLYSQ